MTFPLDETRGSVEIPPDMKNIPKQVKEVRIVQDHATKEMELFCKSSKIDMEGKDEVGVMRRGFQGDHWKFWPAQYRFFPLSAMDMIEILNFLRKP